jgi:small conductance mechanosensitive channel
MHRRIVRKAFGVIILSCLLLCMSSQSVFAESTDTKKPLPNEEVESIIQTLKDPAARDKLIRQLEVLSQAQEPAEQKKAIQGVTARILMGISDRVKTFSSAFVQIGGGISKLPDVVNWVKLQFTVAESRAFWSEVLMKVAVVIGSGYLIFFLTRFLLGRLRRSLASPEQESYMMRLLRLLGLLILDILPVAAFALAAYALLGFADPRETTRLVILSWVNAFIIIWLTVAVFRLLLAPAYPHLRLVGLSDETANYLDIWIHRLLRIAVYGYFGLQALGFLGLPPATYETLLRLLGLSVTVLFIVVIMQNRTTVADFIRGRKPDEAPHEGGRHMLLHRFAQTWHLLAAVYVLLLYGVWFMKIEGGFLFLVRATVITVIVLLLARTALRIVNTLFHHGFKVSEDLKKSFPNLEERANRYISTVRKGLRTAIWILTALAVLQAWGANAIGWLATETGKALLGSAATVLAIVVVTFLIWEIANSLISAYLSVKDTEGNILAQSARNRTIQGVTRKAFFVLLFVVSSMMILSELGVNIGPLLAGAGVLGLAIGFGAQKFVQDVVTGFFILLEDQIAVDDIINVADKGGLVEAVSIRSVRLRDYSGTVHIIPYSSINTVSNMTKEFSFYVFEVGIAYRENVEEVMEVLKQIGAELQEDPTFGPLIKEPLEISGLDSFGDSAVVIKARIKTLPIKQWATGREFNKRMKKRFDELGIEIPFPHRTVYMGQDKEGNSPPLNVDVKEKQS